KPGEAGLAIFSEERRINFYRTSRNGRVDVFFNDRNYPCRRQKDITCMNKPPQYVKLDERHHVENPLSAAKEVSAW
ncbi:MAG TPA: hypothetical protein VMW06_10955, partial [Desulfobacterales bacterium]|nr:hypothetical protein [Desulfobacterales bacterium]